MNEPFLPTAAATQLIDVGTSSASVKLTDGSGPLCVRVYNDGSATAWIEFGDADAAAVVTTSIPVAAGAREVLRGLNTGDGPLHVAAIAAAATGKIYFTPGRGGN